MQTKQTTLKNFLSLSSDDESSEDSVYIPSPTKGAPRIPDQWTRVISRDQMSHSRIRVFDIEKDLKTDKILKSVRAGSTR